MKACTSKYDLKNAYRYAVRTKDDVTNISYLTSGIKQIILTYSLLVR